jgi:hypothetical protein
VAKRYTQVPDSISQTIARARLDEAGGGGGGARVSISDMPTIIIFIYFLTCQPLLYLFHQYFSIF